jgi:hypothetical protein
MHPQIKAIAFTLGAVAVAHPIVASWIPRGNVEKPDCPPVASVVMQATISTSGSPFIGMQSVYDAITDARCDAGFFFDRTGLTIIPSST